MASEGPWTEAIRREAMWAALGERGDVDNVSVELLARVGIRPPKTGQGIFRDLERTRSPVAPDGITLCVLHRGGAYEDAFDDEGGIYHYPKTLRPGRDAPEIEATKNVGRLRVFLFLVSPGREDSTRRVRKAWVSDWNDDAGEFLFTFARTPPIPSDDTLFALTISNRQQRTTVVTARPGQARFKFGVTKRYGAACGVCGLAVPQLLEAAHLCPVADFGSDDARNGVLLCRNHHKAFDEHLFTLEPDDAVIRVAQSGPTAEALGITVADLRHLRARPHSTALTWRWRAWKDEVRASGGRV